MAEAHHEDHGNTPAAWFLTISWVVVWTIGGAAIIMGNSVVVWSAITLGASVVCAVIAGVMKRAGLGRREPRTAPPLPAATAAEAEPERVGAA